MRRHRAILATIFCLLAGYPGSAAADPEPTPADSLAEMERICLGSTQAGGLSERLDALELLALNRTTPGPLPARLRSLRELLLETSMQRPAILFRLNAMEWTLYRRVEAHCLQERLAALEREVLGRIGTGPFAARLEALAPSVWPDGRMPLTQLDLTAGTLVRIKLLAGLSSAEDKAGTSFPFAVADTVYQDGLAVIPRGSTGTGRIAAIDPPRNMGRNARLTLLFGPVAALDGAPVQLTTGAECLEANKLAHLPVQVSAAGMIVLGPAGILSGLFVRGKETVLPEGTELFVQTTTVTSCYTMDLENGR